MNVKIKIGGEEHTIDPDAVPYLAIRMVLDGARAATSSKSVNAGDMHDATLEGVRMMLPGQFKTIDDIKKVITWGEYRQIDDALLLIIKGDEKK